ncbi:MAG: hypothetical protein EBU70_06455 [Actinobacteria bacterium]|nr:hypothetical protein [Actinomycetota bacterium]
MLVGAAWLAVLLPPMIKTRLHGSPGNSMNTFRRQMSSLQSPQGRSSDLRSLSRPLAPSPTRGARRPGYGRGDDMSGALSRNDRSRQARQSREARRREMEVQQRRKNTVVGLVISTATSLFVSVTTGSMGFATFFTASLIATVLYCYWLRQVRIKRENERYLNRYNR